MIRKNSNFQFSNFSRRKRASAQLGSIHGYMSKSLNDKKAREQNACRNSELLYSADNQLLKLNFGLAVKGFGLDGDDPSLSPVSDIILKNSQLEGVRELKKPSYCERLKVSSAIGDNS